ncbi:MAG TPA: glycosyltransferase family 4 protein [Drouetiella sp.]
MPNQIENRMTASSKTICVAHLLFGDGVWGVENYVYNLLASSKSSSVKPLIVCTSEGVISQKFSSSRAEISFVPVRGYFDVAGIMALSKFFEEHKVDLVHVHLGLDSFVGTTAAALTRRPVVMSVHFDQPNYMSYGSLAKRSWNFCQIVKNKSIDHFLPITKNVAKELMKREAVSEEKVTVVHPGIPAFDIDRSCRTRLRAELGVGEQDVVVVGVGRLEIEKNFDCMVRAFAKIENKHVKAWIIGDGSQRSKLEELVVELGLQDTVKLLGYRKDVRDLLASADIFALPSKAEPFGMSAVEAMMSELPVVGTTGPGLGTIVDPATTGILVPPDDELALAGAMEKLAADANRRSTFGLAGRQRAIGNFSSDIMADKIVQIYNNVLARR